MVQIKRFLMMLCVACMAVWSLGCGDGGAPDAKDDAAATSGAETPDGEADHAHDGEEGEEGHDHDEPGDAPAAGSTTGGGADVPPPAPAPEAPADDQ